MNQVMKEIKCSFFLFLWFMSVYVFYCTEDICRMHRDAGLCCIEKLAENAQKLVRVQRVKTNVTMMVKSWSIGHWKPQYVVGYASCQVPLILSC